MSFETMGGIIFIVAISLILLGIRIIKGSNIGGSATNIIITAGICCTFIGISYGLYSFDVEHMENNLGILINGIKTAFIPSAFAISIALFWKLIGTIIVSLQTQNQVEVSGATIDDLMQKQIEQTNFLKEVFNQKDSLLFENLDSIRKEVVIGFRDIGNSFNRFAEKVAEDNSQALIDALQQVIKDFNTKINEQFGENFKHLNEAVGKLLNWQDRYAIELDKKIVFFENLQANLSQQAENYHRIVQNSEAFERSALNLSEMIKVSNQQHENLTLNLEQLSTLCKTLKEDIPSVMTRAEEISRVSQDFLNQIRENEGNLIQRLDVFHQEATKVMQESIANTGTISQNLLHSATDIIEKSLISADKISQDFLFKIKEKDENLMHSLHSFHERAADAMEKGVTGVSEKIGNQVQVIHDSLEKALNDSLNGLGSQLASLSNKFVSDYTPLTEQLKRVVEISKGIK